MRAKKAITHTTSQIKTTKEHSVTFKKVAVAVSGGVDSLFALLSLHEQGRSQGFEVIALHGLFLPQSADSESLQDMTNLCRQLHIPFHTCDVRAPFDALVIDPFVSTYAQGYTPNPCALCNASIKFGLLLDAAHKLGADRLATGHYARLTTNALGMVMLSQADDMNKDQSYFLALVPKERLAAALFPLASQHKKDVVKHVHDWGFDVPMPKESQEVCFVPNDAYRPFIQEQACARKTPLGSPGPIYVREQGTHHAVGQHKGLWQYTEGQRRGIGIAWPTPLYVAARDQAQNALIVSPTVSLKGCRVERLNFFMPYEQWPQELCVRVRHRQHAMPATVLKHEHCLDITFLHTQQATAPGQLAVVYDAQGHVLAGGIITSIS